MSAKFIILLFLISIFTVAYAKIKNNKRQYVKDGSEYSTTTFETESSSRNKFSTNEEDGPQPHEISVDKNNQHNDNHNLNLQTSKADVDKLNNNTSNEVMEFLNQKLLLKSKYKYITTKTPIYYTNNKEFRLKTDPSDTLRVENERSYKFRLPHQARLKRRNFRLHPNRIKRYHQYQYPHHQRHYRSRNIDKQFTIKDDITKHRNGPKDLQYKSSNIPTNTHLRCLQSIPVYCGQPCRANCPTRTYYDVFPNMTVVQPQRNYYQSKNIYPLKQTSIYSGPARNWLGVKKGCNCNVKGSQIRTCEPDTGQCRCKPHFTGLKCDSCEIGYYETGRDCIPCQCSDVGALADTCDATGQCTCRTNVTGRNCNRCKDKHYGFSTKGCRACDLCNMSGHICDQKSGRCICPPNTHGKKCEKCHELHYWENIADKSLGCTQCGCDYYGSLSMICETDTGLCTCHVGYTGTQCQDCAPGYYRPTGQFLCKRCSCSAAGTDPYLGNCTGNAMWEGGHGKQWCGCDRFSGECPCKNNVMGDSCDICKEGTFGLSIDNPDGCTKCFCFGRSSSCRESGLTWGQIRSAPRILSYKPHQNTVLPHTSGYKQNLEFPQEIPETSGDITLTDHLDSQQAIYWRLPPNFEKDLILTYGGYFRFRIDTILLNKSDSNSNRTGSQITNIRHIGAPLIIIDGNHIRLKYFRAHHNQLPGHQTYEIKLDGDRHWNTDNQFNVAPLGARERLMLVLQNVTGIWIRATESDIFDQLTLSDVTLDSALHLLDEPPPHALSVEKCDCPPQYNGSSCQNPSKGYYRQRPISQHDRYIDVGVVGVAIRCECNNRSESCDIESGKCENCRNNTSGERCESCAEGYYGFVKDKISSCNACNCPEEKRNFAISCTQNPQSCKCKEGYEGPTCEKCKIGYYGNPHLLGNGCKQCNCNAVGSRNIKCDNSGKCSCKKEMTGLKCNQCKASRHVINDTACALCDKCVQNLLDVLENFSFQIPNLTDISIGPPRGKLTEFELNVRNISAIFNNFQQKYNDIFSTDFTHKYSSDLKALMDLIKEMRKRHMQNIQQSADLTETADIFLEKLHDIEDNLAELIRNYNNVSTSGISTQEGVRRAEAILKHIQPLSTYTNSQAKHVLMKCENISQILEQLRRSRENDANDVMNYSKDFNTRLNHLNEIMNSHRQNISKFDNVYTDNAVRYKHLKQKVVEIIRQQNVSRNNLEEITDYFEETKQIVQNMSLHDQGFQELKRMIPSLQNELQRMDDFDEIEMNVLNHANNVTQHVNAYTRLFNLDSEDLLAVEASNRYFQIVTNIKQAKDISLSAEILLNETLYVPSDDDSILAKTLITLGDSKRLESRLKNIKDNMRTNIESGMLALYSRLDDIRMRLWAQGVANINDTRRIGSVRASLEKSISKIQEVERNVANSSKTAHIVYNRARDIITDNENNLEKQYAKLLNLTTGDKIDQLKKQIRSIRKLLQPDYINMDIIRNFTYHKNFTNPAMKLNDKLKHLKYIISDAQMKLSTIKVPITGTKCTRFYRMSHHEPSMVSSISISIDLPPLKTTLLSGVNSTLFYVASNEHKQYIQVELLSNSRVLCTLRLGRNHDEIARIYSELTLEEGVSWINLERKYNNVKLYIVNSKKATNPQSIILNDSQIFDVYSNNHIILGGNGSGKTGLPGCLQNVVYNGRDIGLWTFIKSTNCDACKRSESSDASSGADIKMTFNGNGYSRFGDDLGRAKFPLRTLTISITMTTFDENALLYLIAPTLDVLKENNETTLFLAGYLRDGQIWVELHYNFMKPLILQTSQKYNTGREVNFKVTKKIVQILGEQIVTESLTLTVDTEAFQETRILKAKQILRVKKSDIFFGGVSGNFRTLYSNTVLDKLKINNGLLGVLDANILTYIGIYSKDFFEFTGLEKHYGDLSFSNALFVGTGKLTLATNLTKSLEFLVRTDQKNTTIVRIEPQKATIRLQNNHVRLSFSEQSFNQKSITESINPYISQSSNCISLHITENTDRTTNNADSILILSVNGIEVDRGFMNGSVNGFLEFGLDSLNGSIRDVRVDDESIEFSARSVPKFNAVEIGRSRVYENQNNVNEVNTPISSLNPVRIPLRIHHDPSTNAISTTSSPMMDEQQLPFVISIPTVVYTLEEETLKKKSIIHGENCTNITPKFMQNAAGFGLNGNGNSESSTESYVLHRIKDRIWQGEYEVQLEFRTYERDALLFLAMDLHSISSRRRLSTPHCNILLLRNGYLYYQVNGKRTKSFPIPSLVTLSDGNWHTVTLRTNFILGTKKRRLIVKLDGREVKSNKKMPANKLGGFLYVGGISKDLYGTAIGDLIPLKQFRGCIQNFKINHIVLKFENSPFTELHHIGQCFPHIEYGSYFSGDSFAKYRHKASIQTKLSTSLYYRTISSSYAFDSILLTTSIISVEAEPPPMMFTVQLLSSGFIVASLGETNVSFDLNYNNYLHSPANSFITDYDDRKGIKKGEGEGCITGTGEWHHVIAGFGSDVLQLIVDGVRKDWVLPRHQQELLREYADYDNQADGLYKDHQLTDGFIYIGGVPSNFQTRWFTNPTNFKGCIKEVRIMDDEIDWLQMDDLHNIIINSCPKLE